MRVLLSGPQARDLEREFEAYESLDIVRERPDTVVCYGGDGTLLAAELQWPSVPKVPIRNSRRGNRCIAHPAPAVIARLAANELFPTQYMKLACAIRRGEDGRIEPDLLAMNEFNVHMARINSAVRFSMWIDDEPYANGREILGDGFVISTPFGSTAYFEHITRGFFHTGIGVAFKSTSEHTNHVVMPELAAVRILIARGPAVLAFDNSKEYVNLRENDEILVRRHTEPATILTWTRMKYPSDAF